MLQTQLAIKMTANDTNTPNGALKGSGISCEGAKCVAKFHISL